MANPKAKAKRADGKVVPMEEIPTGKERPAIIMDKKQQKKAKK